MKKIIFKKLSNEILIFFLVSSLALTLIVWVIQAVNYLDIVTEDGHSYGVYFKHTILSLPKLFSQLLPFVFFISVFYIINLYEENNQLLVYWTHGITKNEFINKIIKFSLFYFIIQLVLSIIIIPYTNNMSRSFIRSSTLDFFPNLIKPKKFIDTVENLTIFIESKDEEGFYRNVILKDDSNPSISQIIIASYGKIVLKNGQKILLLNDGQIIQANTKKETTTFSFEETQFDLQKYSTKTTKFPKIQELETAKLIKCTKILLRNFEKVIAFKDLTCRKEFFDNLIQELFKRIYKPINIILLALAASLQILRSKNSHNYALFKAIVFIIGISLIIIPEILLNFTGTNYLNNLLFLLSPILFFFIIYYYIHLKIKFN